MKKPNSRRVRTSAIALAGLATISLALAAGYHARGAYRYLNVFQEVWGLTQANYVESVDESALLRGAYRGMLSSLDAASAYLEPAEERALASPPGPARAGMQVLLSGGIPVVVRIDREGPAAAAGIARGDQLWRLDGEPLRQSPLPVLERRLSGEPGDVLQLVVLDASTYKRREVKVTLAVPSDPGFELAVEEGPVLRLRVLDAGRIEAGALARALDEAESSHPGAPLLVDLRGTVGTDVNDVRRLAGTFFPGGQLMKLVPREGDEEPVTAETGGPAAFSGELFVLVDGGTAGTGEAIAAVSRESAGAVLCGRKTYGLGAVPEVIPLTHGGSVLLTTREMATAAGTTWSDDGIEPDKLLAAAPRIAREDDDGEPDDRMLAAALEWIREGAAVAERPAA